MSYLLVHKDRNKLQADGWTYGDWRQYVAFFPDNSARCCRASTLPMSLAMFGLAFAALPVMAVFMAYQGVPVAWPNVICTALAGLAMLVPEVVTWLTPWRLMVPVSKKMMPNEDGHYLRDI